MIPFLWLLKNDESSDEDDAEDRNVLTEAISVQPEPRSVNETTGLNPSDKPPSYTSGKNL